MEDRNMSRIKSLLFLIVLAAQVPPALAKVTYQVGGCLPKLTSFSTITLALQASPSPDVVEICPGVYLEQVVITLPVTLEGISASNSLSAFIARPAGGLVANATDEFGDSLAAQVLVENASGEVNLNNLLISPGGQQTGSSFIVGVFYHNSSGTMDHLEVENQNGNGLGVAVWLDGGLNRPTVTLENSILGQFDYAGVLVKSYNPALTVNIKGNDVTSAFPNADGIYQIVGATSSVSGNLITGMAEGVLIDGGEATISKNKVVATGVGIDIETDGVSATSNTIDDGIGFAVGILANSTVAPVTGNTIAQSNYAIIFDCVAGKNVHSNTILDASIGLYSVPTGTVSTNTYYNVGTNSTGGC
jgi:hypothetical protein